MALRLYLGKARISLKHTERIFGVKKNPMRNEESWYLLIFLQSSCSVCLVGSAWILRARRSLAVRDT